MTAARTRLWFRIDEILPLAEHAMACPEHRITPAQLHGGAAARPALIWTATADTDTLTSNGSPTWYGPTGSPYAVDAYTWRHTATGRSGTPTPADPGRGFLRLHRRYRDGRRPLIDVLRRAKPAEHWLVIDPAQTPTGYTLADHRDDIAPSDAVWKPAVVAADAVGGGNYPAVIADGYTTSYGLDDVIARFDRGTVEQLVADLNAIHADTDPDTDAMPGEDPLLHFDGDVLIVSFEHDDGYATRLVEVDRSYPDTEGRYSVGVFLWPWTAPPQ